MLKTGPVTTEDMPLTGVQSIKNLAGNQNTPFNRLFSKPFSGTNKTKIGGKKLNQKNIKITIKSNIVHKLSWLKLQ
jgi:hypothetical protein